MRWLFAAHPAVLTSSTHNSVVSRLISMVAGSGESRRILRTEVVNSCGYYTIALGKVVRGGTIYASGVAHPYQVSRRSELPSRCTSGFTMLAPFTTNSVVSRPVIQPRMAAFQSHFGFVAKFRDCSPQPTQTASRASSLKPTNNDACCPAWTLMLIKAVLKRYGSGKSYPAQTGLSNYCSTYQRKMVHRDGSRSDDNAHTQYVANLFRWRRRNQPSLAYRKTRIACRLAASNGALKRTCS